MSLQRQTRQIGDIQIAIAATLKRPDGTVVDLTDKTLKFTMVAATDGTVKVAETSTGASITSATDGEVQYTPVAADVDTAGVYNAYFIVEDASNKQDTFPAKTSDFQIVIEPLSR